MFTWKFAGAIALGAMLGGCVDEEMLGDEELGESVAPLISEQWGGVAEVVARYYNDPGIALRSYAVARYRRPTGLCSATMIGPNVMMTAAHCGAERATAQFRTYRNLDPMQSDTEEFQCDYLVSTFCDNDTILYFCEPNAAGENPGDKYGYLDFDVNQPAVGAALYSVWWNWIDSLGLPDAHIYSAGKVTSNTDNGWYVANNNGTGIVSDLWGQGGASGSSHLNPSNGRIQVGPLSSAYSGGGRARWAASMRNILYWGKVTVGAAECPTAPVLNTTAISNLGLTPDTYKGWIDEDSNWLFDVQEDLEKRRGEAARDWLWLGFESERRNALWTKSSAATFYPLSGWVHLAKSTWGTDAALRHTRLHFSPGATYRLSFQSWTSSASSSSAVRVTIEKGGVVYATYTVNTSLLSSWRNQVFQFTAPVADAEVRVSLDAPVTTYVRNLRIVRQATYADFDTHDERMGWRNLSKGGIATILPDGSGSGPNWAALVTREPSVGMGNDWTVSSQNLALVPGRNYVICHQTRKYAGAAPAGDWGIMRVLSGGSTVRQRTFRPGDTTYQGNCTDELTVPSADTQIDFGVYTPSGGPSYVMDELLIYQTN